MNEYYPESSQNPEAADLVVRGEVSPAPKVQALDASPAQALAADSLPHDVAKALMLAAVGARGRAYAPYSHYRVGAALLGRDGKIYTGCNIESASYSPTNCAERTALFKAVSEGVTAFAAIAIVGGREGEAGGFCPPCGVCRQMLAEFCPPTLPILLGTPEDFSAYPLGELLPFSFTKSSL